MENILLVINIILAFILVSLILLQKTLLNIEGLGRELYPDLNLWETALPFLEAWLKQRYSATSIIQRLQTKIPSLLEKMPEVPELIYRNLSDPNHFKVEIESLRTDVQRLEKVTTAERSSRRRSYFGILLLILLAIFYLSQVAPPPF